LIERASDGSGKILSNIVRSQTAEHARFGGVVPEIAARAHVDLLDGIVGSAIEGSRHRLCAVIRRGGGRGPRPDRRGDRWPYHGQAIAMVHDTPLIAVNHLEAHALTPRLTCALAFPYCLFLASGGHTQIVAVVGVGNYCGSAPPWMTPWGKPSTRSQKCCRCLIQADRKWNVPPAEVTQSGSRFRDRCSDGRMRISRCRD